MVGRLASDRASCSGSMIQHRSARCRDAPSNERRGALALTRCKQRLAGRALSFSSSMRPSEPNASAAVACDCTISSCRWLSRVPVAHVLRCLVVCAVALLWAPRCLRSNSAHRVSGAAESIVSCNQPFSLIRVIVQLRNRACVRGTRTLPRARLSFRA